MWSAPDTVGGGVSIANTSARSLDRSNAYVPSSCHLCAHRASRPSSEGFSGTRRASAAVFVIDPRLGAPPKYWRLCFSCASGLPDDSRAPADCPTGRRAVQGGARVRGAHLAAGGAEGNTAVVVRCRGCAPFTLRSNVEEDRKSVV